jgi:putative ABC transport system permease protein
MQSNLPASVRPALLALSGAVVFLLLIACANVANLMIVRAGLRERECAVRVAFGASRWQSVRPLLAESLCLSVAGVILGIVLARFALRLLVHAAPASLPRFETISIDLRALLFSALAGLVTVLASGLIPLLSASRHPAASSLRGACRTTGLNDRGTLPSVVVVVEVALSFVLLVSSGLMFRSFLAQSRTDLGYEPQHLLTFQLLGAPSNRADGPKQASLKQNILRRLSALPGVAAATASYPFPLTGNYAPIRWGLEDAVNDPAKFRATDFQFVLPGYFETMRNRIIAGRVFNAADNQPGRNLVVIDNLLAAKAFSGRSAIGQRILIRVRTPQPEWVEIIGVVAHQRNQSPATEGREQVYFTDAFGSGLVANRFAVRTTGDPALLAQTIAAELRAIDPTLGMAKAASMADLLEAVGSRTRFTLLLIAAFTTIAVLLTGIGLYRVMSTLVRARTAELGVRIALGASRASVLGLVMSKGLGLSAVGLVAGLAGSLTVTRLLNSLLVGVKAADPLTYSSMALLYLVLAALACLLPARRAANLLPAGALRSE